MKMNWFTFFADGTKEQAEEQILAGVTLQNRPTMMENKLEEGGILYGNSENGIFWIVKKSERGGILPQRIFNGQILSKEEKTVIGGRFAFVGGFHLMWLVCMIVAAAAILMMVQSLPLTIITAVLFGGCWFVASFWSPRAYRAEERQVLEYLGTLFSDTEEETTEE